MSRAERRLAFSVAFKNGSTISEASRMVGVSRNTGQNWANQIRAQHGLDRERESIVQKQRLAEIYSTIVQDDEESAAYRIDAGSNLSKLMGYDAPSRSITEVRQIPPNVEAWMTACITLNVGEESKAIDQPDPPKALPDKALPPSD